MPERIVFDRSLYSPAAIESAAALFAEHAKIDIQPQDEGIVAEIEAVEGYDPALVAHTFGNHVLHDTIAGRHHAAEED